MEFLHLIPTTIIASIVFLLFLHYYSKNICQNKERLRAPPEAGGGWPVIGHVLILGGPEMPHITLAKMADKCGPLFSIRLGIRRALIVSNSALAKECFTTHDSIFSDRPKTIAMEHMAYNYAMFAFSPYGQYWRDIRKIATLELLSTHRISIYSPIRESELKSSIKGIYDLWVSKKLGESDKVQVEMKSWFGGLALNVISRIVVGKRRREAIISPTEVDHDPWMKALRDFFELMGVFTVSDAIPMLRWLDLGGYEKAMKKTAKELDFMLSGCLEEHKQRKASEEAKDDQDFMGVLLSILENSVDQAYDYDVDTVNKATCLAMILAASDTTTITLTWALSLLLNNRNALRKSQEELDRHVGRTRQVKESDLKNLVYIRAIIKETLRLYSPTQLTPPRQSIDDCTLGGYHVPAGTQLFLNLWKIHRDPEMWPDDPMEFKPERFLTTHKDVDMKGQHFEWFPFGSGRRACPGANFGIQVTMFMLVSFLHGFEVTAPSDEPVDMTERLGMTNIKATPLDVLLIPRLSLQKQIDQVNPNTF